jgi:hypothetical protein
MIRFEALQLQRLAADALRRLTVTDTVHTTEVRELPDGTWLVQFEDLLPASRFPIFDLYIQPEWTPEQAARELRVELRKRLWICPLCQRRAGIRRLVDREAFRVECDQCGRYEMDAGLLEYLRTAFEDSDEAVLVRLPRLAARVRERAPLPCLTLDNWAALGESTTS